MKRVLFYLFVFLALAMLPARVGAGESSSQPLSYEWVSRYCNTLDKDVRVAQVIDVLFEIKSIASQDGEDLSLVSEVVLESMELLENQLEYSEEGAFCKLFYEEVLSREAVLLGLPEEERERDFVQMSILNQFTKGFCTVVIGKMLSVLPQDEVREMGSTLVVIGMKRMLIGYPYEQKIIAITEESDLLIAQADQLIKEVHESNERFVYDIVALSVAVVVLQTILTLLL